MDQNLQRIVDSLLKVVQNLPSTLNAAALARLLLSAFLLVLSIITFIKSKRDGDRVLDLAVERLKSHIRNRMSRPELMTANSLRGLAKSIQTEMRTPAILDSSIAQAIRSVALEMEESYRGVALVRRLEMLDAPLKELYPEGGGLLSIAAIDRMFAYFLSGSILLAYLIVFQISAEVAFLLLGSRCRSRACTRTSRHGRYR
jgi:hypothetical protein